MTKNIIFKTLLLVFISWDAFAFMQEDDSYYKPSGSIRTLEKLSAEMSLKTRIKTLDLSEVPYINIDDKFIQILSESETAASMININLSNTKITEASLPYILNGKWGTKRDYTDYKLSHKYSIPVSEVLINVTGTNIKAEALSTFEQFFIKKRTDEPIKIKYIREISSMPMAGGSKYHEPMFQEFGGMRVLFLVNKPFSKLTDNVPFRIVKKISSAGGEIRYLSMTKEEKEQMYRQSSAASSSKQKIKSLPSSNLEKLPWFELAKRYEKSLAEKEADYQRLGSECQRLEGACQRLNEENYSFVRKMILAKEPDSKILQYTGISPEKLQELKSSLSQISLLEDKA